MICESVLPNKAMHRTPNTGAGELKRSDSETPTGSYTWGNEWKLGETRDSHVLMAGIIRDVYYFRLRL